MEFRPNYQFFQNEEIYEVILVVVVYMRDKFTNLKLDKENQCLG